MRPAYIGLTPRRYYEVVGANFGKNCDPSGGNATDWSGTVVVPRGHDRPQVPPRNSTLGLRVVQANAFRVAGARGPPNGQIKQSTIESSRKPETLVAPAPVQAMLRSSTRQGKVTGALFVGQPKK